MPDYIDISRMGEATIDLPDAILDAVKQALLFRQKQKDPIDPFSYTITGGEVKITTYEPAENPVAVCQSDISARETLPEIVVLVKDSRLNSLPAFILRAYENEAQVAYVSGQLYENNGQTDGGRLHIHFIGEEKNFLYELHHPEKKMKEDSSKPWWKVW